MLRLNLLAKLLLAIGLIVLLLMLSPGHTNAAPRTPNITLSVNSSGDGNTRDTDLTLREALLIAQNQLWQCLTDGERAHILGVSWSPVIPNGCNNITSYVDSSWIIFYGVGVVYPTSQLPDVPCNTWISSDFSKNRLIAINGTSAGSSDGLRLNCTTSPSNISIQYLTVRNFSGNGIYAAGIQTAWLLGLSIFGNGTGIYLNKGSSLNLHNNHIGSINLTDRNFVFGNTGDGIHIEGQYALDANPMFNVVENNYVGIDPLGVQSGNGGHGIELTNAWNNTIGGDNANQGNVVSNNAHDGVSINGLDSRWNSVYNNIIGLNPAANAKMGNTWSGLSIFTGSTANYIGNPAKGNIISGNGGGIYISDSSASGNQIMSNAIGTNWSFAANLGNNSQGVGLYYGANGNFIGEHTAGMGNYIGGNSGPGIDIAMTGTSSNYVSGNIIGTNSAGTVAVPNSIGVRIDGGATNNVIGGWTADYRNLISGNTGPGVGIYNTGTTGNSVLGNYIGTNAAGTTALGNAMQGVIIQEGASNNTINRNLISGNAWDGVNINGAGTSSNTVDGNTIGTNDAETSAIPNGGAGISVSTTADNNNIGSSPPNASQLISGNAHEGIYISNVSGTLIGASNDIGVAWDRTSPLGNGLAGIYLDGSTNTIVEASRIAYNGGAGIAVVQNTAVSNRIRVTTIKNNSGLPIDLGNDGFTRNGMHVAPGPNNWINYPVITSHTATTITGSARANGTVLVYQAIGNPTAPGGGGIYQGSVTVNGAGVWQWTLSGGLKYSDYSFVVCAIYTICADTSEMSPRLYEVNLPLVTKNYSGVVAQLAPPDSLIVTGTTPTDIDISWHDNTNNEDGYNIDLSTNHGANWTLNYGTLPVASYTYIAPGIIGASDNARTPGTEYCYRVRAYKGTNTSEPSNMACATTPPNGPPNTPTNLNLTIISNTLVLLTWTNNSSSTGSDNFAYELYESDNGSAFIDIGPVQSNPCCNTLAGTNITYQTAIPGGMVLAYKVQTKNTFGSSGMSAPSNSVAAPGSTGTTATQFTNNSSYPIISLVIDGVEQFPSAPQGIPSKANYLKQLGVAGHTCSASNGFWNGASRQTMYTFPCNFTQSSGVTGQVTFNNPTISQLMTRFGSSGYWVGEYWSGTNLNSAAFRFYSNGSYTFYNNGVAQSSGSYSLVSYPGSYLVTFSTGGYQGILDELHGLFDMRNGPADWPTIEYSYAGP